MLVVEAWLRVLLLIGPLKVPIDLRLSTKSPGGRGPRLSVRNVLCMGFEW